MVTKQELRRVRQAGVGLREIRYQIKELTESLDGLKAQQISGMPRGGGNHNQIEDSVIRLDELRTFYAGKVLAFHAEQERIEKQMSVLDIVEATAIRMYYFHRLTWEQVADEMNYTRDGINKIHGRALYKLLAA